jgi:hypothetical protein
LAFKAMGGGGAMWLLALGVALRAAAAAPLEWEIRDAGHPVLGNIHFAFLKKVVVTPVGKDNVFSGAYVSCQAATRKIALELTNTKAVDDPGGLSPNRMPRLLCKRPASRGGSGVVQDELSASWQVNGTGDALAHGLDAAVLRECTSIGIVQDVALPQAWERKTAQVLFEISPYDPQLDSIFAACGEVSAYAPVRVKEAAIPWRTARIASGGKTNVRAEPHINAGVVVQLAPGAAVRVQKAKGEWWRVKQKSGATFEGYIRQDRLVFK